VNDLFVEQKKAIEVHIYTWMDSTLSDLQALIKKALRPGEMEETITMYRTLKTEEDVLVKKMGVVSTTSTNGGGVGSVSQTLHSVSFNPGDEILVTMG